jgi:modulator of FtsH protease HflK
MIEHGSARFKPGEERDMVDSHDFREIHVPRPNVGVIRNVLVLILAVGAVVSSFYQVQPEEIAVVLRFGKYVRSSDPGLHFRLPFGVERVLKVPVQRQLKEEFGFRTVKADIRSEYASQGFEAEANMLTGDLNAANVEWVVQYRIVDPYKYLFQVREPAETLRSMSEAVMRRVVGDRTVNEVLTVGRAEVASEVEVALEQLCKDYAIGLQVEQVVLQDVNPPDPVKPSFNEVNEAQQEKERLINQAQSEYNRVIPRAEGEALQLIQQAEGYALQRVNEARGDSARFTQVYEAYRLAPEVTRKRIYLETLAKVLPKVDHKVIVDDDLRSIVPLLNLGGGAK